MVRNVNVNVYLCFRISCELVGWLNILGFPVNFLGDWLLPNIKRWTLYSVQVVSEGGSFSWGGVRTKGEVREFEITKMMFLHSDLLKLCLKKKYNIAEFFPDTSMFYD